MKFMWLTPECPYPANTGGRVGIWKRITHLATTNEIHLYTIIDEEHEKQYASDIIRYCKDVKFYNRKSKLQALISSICLPYPAVSRWNSQLKKDLELDYEKINPDWVIVDFPQMMGVLPENIIRSNRLVLNQHNIEFLSMQSLSEGMRGWKKLIYGLVSRQMERYEASIYRCTDIRLFTFVSSKDKEYFEKRFHKKNTFLVPVGAEVHDCEICSGSHKLLFVAKMSYPANEEGAIWLVDKIMPQILQIVPDAYLYLVGKDPMNKLIDACKGKDYVELTGTVECLQPYYDECNLVVVPIMTGGGVNVKLLEALGQDKLVVTTSKGIEGTDFQKDVHLKVTDDEIEFANDCIDILLKPTSSENSQRKQKAHELMNEKYSWAGITKLFEIKLKQLMNDNVN